MQIKVSPQLINSIEWKLGDVVASDTIEDFALIAKDNNGKFVALDLGDQYCDSYSTQEEYLWFGPVDSVEELKEEMVTCGFQKVNAKLDVKKPVIDEKEEKKMMIETGITSEEWNIGDVIVSEKKQGIALMSKIMTACIAQWILMHLTSLLLPTAQKKMLCTIAEVKAISTSLE